MSESPIDHIVELLRARSYEHARLEEEVRAYLDKRVSVRIRMVNDVPRFRVRFGIMSMAAEMALSIGFFSILLVISLAVKDAKHPLLPYLAIAAFVINLLFELSRYRIAKAFIDDIRHGVEHLTRGPAVANKLVPLTRNQVPNMMRVRITSMSADMTMAELGHCAADDAVKTFLSFSWANELGRMKQLELENAGSVVSPDMTFTALPAHLVAQAEDTQHFNVEVCLPRPKKLLGLFSRAKIYAFKDVSQEKVSRMIREFCADDLERKHQYFMQLMHGNVT